MRILFFYLSIALLSQCQPMELWGEIKDYDGKPINGALIVNKRAGQPIAKIHADETGYFTLNGMRLDDTVTVAAPGFESDTTFCDYPLAQHSKLTFWLKRKK